MSNLKRGALIGAASISVMLMAGSLAVPALGGPKAVSAVSALKMAKKALSKANQADRRSEQALAEAQKRGPQGPPGAPGPAGVRGPAGSPGNDAFGALTYVYGVGSTTSIPGDYAADVAYCPLGQVPIGGGSISSGGEPGGSLGDLGDGPVDTDDPADGVPDSWLAATYKATGSAESFAAAVCAPADSVAVAARPAARPDSAAGKLRDSCRSGR
jgi:hypothetical protein